MFDTIKLNSCSTIAEIWRMYCEENFFKNCKIQRLCEIHDANSEPSVLLFFKPHYLTLILSTAKSWKNKFFKFSGLVNNYWAWLCKKFCYAASKATVKIKDMVGFIDQKRQQHVPQFKTVIVRVWKKVFNFKISSINLTCFDHIIWKSFAF